ncbi:MAG: lipoprotein N-acyltransferase Lnb domain-containing protein [Planctomycetota bacterium]|jgi:hypothetical protein
MDPEVTTGTQDAVDGVPPWPGKKWQRWTLAVAWFMAALWGTGLIWFQTPGPSLAGQVVAVLFAAGFPVAWWRWHTRRRAVTIAFAVAMALLAARWATIYPAITGDWSPEYGKIASAEFDGDVVTVRNVRDCRHSDDGVEVRYYDATYDLTRLEHVDFLVIPFGPGDALAHTMLTFGFDDGRWLAVSVEVRYRNGVHYHPVTGAFREYELCYVVADERDVLHLRTNIRRNKVFLLPIKAKPGRPAELLRAMLERTTSLSVKPEFYNTLTDNCTTAIVHHVNDLYPGTAPMDWRILLPGSMGKYVYDLGMVDTDLPFEQAMEKFRVDPLVQDLDDLGEYSKVLRSRR